MKSRDANSLFVIPGGPKTRPGIQGQSHEWCSYPGFPIARKARGDVPLDVEKRKSALLA